jgi:hypothetical protein
MHHALALALPSSALGQTATNFAPGATLALDFQRKVFRSTTQTVSDPSLLTGWSFTRASTKTAFNSSGAVVSFGTGVPAITDLGFLVEEARTNSFLNSAIGVTQSVTTTAAPWTLSFWGTGSITLSGGATGTLNGTGANNRVSLTVTATAASTTLTVTGSITNVQFELGTGATSYIPTTGAAATRAADVPTISGLTIPATGTMLVKGLPNMTSTVLVQRYGFLNGASAEISISRFNVESARFGIVDGGVAQATIDTLSNTCPVGSVFKEAGAWAVNDFAATLNGGTVGTDASGTVPTVASLAIGHNGSGAQQANGYIQQIAIYPTRLSNAQIVALTQ